jgi:hypothetical protein
MDKDFILELKSEINKEIENLHELLGEMETIKDKDAVEFRRAKGSILHDFYNCCERIFKRISIDINGGTEDTKTWHKSLLYKMTIPIKELRPRVISDETAAMLDEFLSFRHVFRNIYGFELKGDRIDYLSNKFPKAVHTFISEIHTFVKAL